MVPTTGAEGVDGCVLITMLPDSTEIHPAALVTVQVYVPETRPDIVVLVPVPVVVTPPGLRVNVHVPLAGNPLNNTLPVDTAHVVCVMVPTTGAAGVDGCVLITTLPDATEVHPAELVTVQEYVPDTRPEIVVLVPVPVVVTPPGVRVNVHVPLAGNTLNTTLPVATKHVV